MYNTDLLQVSLNVYKMERMISPYVDALQRTVCKWNHCAIQINQTVIHTFDDYDMPRWVSQEADRRLFNVPRDSYVVGLSPMHLAAFRAQSNIRYKKMSKYDKLSRHLWYYTAYLWPKRNDCVYNCSWMLELLFPGFPICFTTPDDLTKAINDYWIRRNHRSYGIGPDCGERSQSIVFQNECMGRAYYIQ